MAAQPGLVVNGWTILVHKLFLDQISAIVAEIERARSKAPINFSKKNCAKRLAAILKLALEDIPHNPANPLYRQGGTIGNDWAALREAAQTGATLTGVVPS